MAVKLRAIIELSRPSNVLITFISVVVAALIAADTLSVAAPMMLAALSASLIAAGANTINDVFDLWIDKINKPHRPLPSGRVTPAAAQRIALVEFGLGNLLALWLSGDMLAVALTFSMLLYLYSYALKATVLWGNFAVSLSAAAAFIYGGMAVDRPTEALIPAGFAFFYHFGREILKDLQDQAGDKAQNAETLAVRYGAKVCVRFIWLNFTILILLTLFPFLMGWYGWRYLAAVVIGVYPVLLYVMISVSRRQSPAHLNVLSNLLKADMLVGLLAIVLR